MEKCEATKSVARDYGLGSTFDIEQHKAKYKNYLEVIIDANGTIMYAVPSHQEKASELA